MAKKKIPVGLFSWRPAPRKLTDRLVSSALGIDFNAIKRQKMEEADFEKAAAGGSEFGPALDAPAAPA